MEREITLTVNGEKKTIKVDFRQSLLDVIREDLGLTGAKQGCGVGECGACAVLVNGETIDSCIYLAVWADGKEIGLLKVSKKTASFRICKKHSWTKERFNAASVLLEY